MLDLKENFLDVEQKIMYIIWSRRVVRFCLPASIGVNIGEFLAGEEDTTTT
ncbi:MAG: hypothetical protein HUJ74_03500 [Lachnospiraceae bacterium]|nr:hypothetical protein [Lachnospiraceae bacterium]